jgi:hypothetical protein
LDYDTILIQQVQILLITFDGDVLFKLPSLLPNAHNLSQMQGMDRKYSGHAWCKLITTNIKNSLEGLLLGALVCVQDDCEKFVHSGSCNEISWCGECIHIPIVG